MGAGHRARSRTPAWRSATPPAIRATAGGASWQSFREGLPPEHCYDVIYRHALDARGDRVCFGTTTGNVYISEDRGQTWRCLGNNLPPIHSVRFA